MKKNILLLAVMLAALSGCASKGYDDVITSIPSSGYKSEIEAYKLQEAEMNKPNPSLWSDVGSSGTIFLDYKARRIGDVVIVRIEEDSSASNAILCFKSFNSSILALYLEISESTILVTSSFVIGCKSSLEISLLSLKFEATTSELLILLKYQFLIKLKYSMPKTLSVNNEVKAIILIIS